MLAHPSDIEHLEELITRLQKVGLVGIEAYYNGYSQKVVKYLASLASKYGLVASGGSDYHGLGNLDETPMGGVAVPVECVTKLFSLVGQKAPA